jgi:hypothetical protein
MHRKELWAVLIVVVGVAIFLIYTAAGAIGQILAFNSGTQSTATAVDESGWQTYTNNTYNFSVQYPQDWELSTGDPSGAGPVALIGNPLSGTSTYVINISIASNTSSLSSGEYVHQFLKSATAQDQANASSGPAPQLTPQFSKSFILTVGGQNAYELYDVYEYDHGAERIYVADGTSVIIFDFPLAEENPNIHLPVNNNEIAHDIVNTLMVN